MRDLLFYILGVVLTGALYYVVGRAGREAWDRAHGRRL